MMSVSRSGWPKGWRTRRTAVISANSFPIASQNRSRSRSFSSYSKGSSIYKVRKGVRPRIASFGKQRCAHLRSNLEEAQEQKGRKGSSRNGDPTERSKDLEGKEQKIEPDRHAQMHLICIGNWKRPSIIARRQTLREGRTGSRSNTLKGRHAVLER